MKKWLPILAGLLVVFLWLLLWLANPRFLAAVSSQTYDMLLKLLAEPRRSSHVVIADIDDKSIAELGQWPWPRFQLSRLVEKTFQAGAAVMVFDVVYSEKDRLSPAQVLDTWTDIFGSDAQLAALLQGREDFDSMFASTVSRHPVVLGCYMNDRLAEQQATADWSSW